MTPKEKAKELYNKFCTMKSHCDDAQEIALIAVDEIIEVINIISSTDSQHDYWQQVRKEIENYENANLRNQRRMEKV